MCSYQAFDLLVGDVQEYSFKLKYRLIFVHWVFYFYSN
jgi:hypothetical protein